MEQVSFRPVGEIKDQAIADSLTKWGRQLEYLFNVKLTGDDIHSNTLAGDALVTIIDDRSTDITYSPAAQAASSSNPWYQLYSSAWTYNNTRVDGHGGISGTVSAPTFTRASVAYEQDGTQVASGTPRYETGKYAQGITIEEGTTNLLTITDSQGFSAPVNVTVTSGQTYTVSMRSGTGSIVLSDAGTGTVSVGTSVTFTASTTTLTLTPTGTVGRTQVENKAYATQWQIGGTARAAETLTIPTAGVLSATAGTVEGWVKLFRAPGTISQYIIEAPGVGANQYLTVEVNTAGKIRAQYGTGGSVVTLLGTTTLAKDTLYHFAIRWASTGATLFLNGVSEATSATAPGMSFATTAYIGVTSVNSAYLDGIIDDLRISSRARTDAEILANYNSSGPAMIDGDTTYKLSFDDSLVPIMQSLEYRFTGTAVVVTGESAANSGKIDIYIDGVFDSTVDMYTVAGSWLVGRYQLYKKENLSKGPHTIKIVVRNDKNSAASDYKFFFDGLRVGQGLGLKQLDVIPAQSIYSVATDSNGYASINISGDQPAGGSTGLYSIFALTGASLVSPDPSSTSTSKPTVGTSGQLIYVWDGPVSSTVQIRATALFMGK